MAELSTLARPYAKAAFQAACEGKQLAAWSEMLSYAAIAAQNERMKNSTGTPVVDE